MYDWLGRLYKSNYQEKDSRWFRFRTGGSRFFFIKKKGGGSSLSWLYFHEWGIVLKWQKMTFFFGKNILPKCDGGCSPSPPLNPSMHRVFSLLSIARQANRVTIGIPQKDFSVQIYFWLQRDRTRFHGINNHELSSVSMRQQYCPFPFLKWIRSEWRTQNIKAGADPGIFVGGGGPPPQKKL